MPRGKLFIISGPSGVGKTTIRDRLLETVPNLKPVITATTRSPRPGETHGVDFMFFEDRESLLAIPGGLLEMADVHGNFYGTPRAFVDEILDSGSHALIILDVQGAASVRDQMDCVSMFIHAPSTAELERRLRSRPGSSPEDVERRLANAVGEILRSGEYDLQFVNSDVQETVLMISEALSSIITSPSTDAPAAMSPSSSRNEPLISSMMMEASISS